MAQGLTNRVRIISGHYRGRWLNFPDADGLRPTTGPIRETLFNWLQPFIAGASCLDLFAGTGALGFEAASRAAVRVLMLEQNPKVCAALKDNQQRLGLGTIELIAGDALAWLRSGPQRAPFDLIFLDPPFQTRLIEECLVLFDQGPSGIDAWLKPQGLMYLEQDATRPWPTLPESLTWYRQKVTGQVRYGLLTRQGAR